jgi:hypothetical protein
MSRRLTIVLLVWMLSVHGASPSTSASGDALDADITSETRESPAINPAAPPPLVRAGAATQAAVPPHVTSANPLWGIPLTKLSGTRDRPIFSPSRRPAPVASNAEPVIVRPPPRKKDIEPPQLALVGTIASRDDSFGIFVDPSTKAALRLKVGDDFQGWKLTIIQGREVIMGKDGRVAVLTLPQPGGQSGDVRLLPVDPVVRR